MYPLDKKMHPKNDFAPPNLKRGCVCIKIRVISQNKRTPNGVLFVLCVGEI